MSQSYKLIIWYFWLIAGAVLGELPHFSYIHEFGHVLGGVLQGGQGQITSVSSAEVWPLNGFTMMMGNGFTYLVCLLMALLFRKRCFKALWAGAWAMTAYLDIAFRIHPRHDWHLYLEYWPAAIWNSWIVISGILILILNFHSVKEPKLQLLQTEYDHEIRSYQK